MEKFTDFKIHLSFECVITGMSKFLTPACHLLRRPRASDIFRYNLIASTFLVYQLHKRCLRIFRQIVKFSLFSHLIPCHYSGNKDNYKLKGGVSCYFIYP